MRYDDWEERLYKRMEEWNGRAFEWGKTDCVAFCGSCVEAITGIDPTVEYRGQYDSLLGATRILELGSLPERLTLLFGESVPVSFAQRGDLVYAEDEAEGPQLGICNGEITMSWGAEGALKLYPTLALQRAWHVR